MTRDFGAFLNSSKSCGRVLTLNTPALETSHPCLLTCMNFEAVSSKVKHRSNWSRKESLEDLSTNFKGF